MAASIASPRPIATTGKDLSWLAKGEARMQWRVMVELSSADGSVQTCEVHVGGCLPAVCSAETLGLTQAQAKQLLAALQRHLVQAQTEEYCQSRRRRPRCGAQRPLKDRRPRQLRSLFG